MSTSSMLKAALSEDETLVAVIVPSTDRGVIQIYRKETGFLQSTLTTRKANSVQASQKSDATLQTVQFCGNHHVVAKTPSSILLWDLARGGVVSQTIGEQQNVLDVTCFQGRIYLLIGISSSRRSSASGMASDDEDDNHNLRLEVHQYDPTSGKILRKIKCKKSKEGSEFGMALVTKTDGTLLVLVRCNDGISAFDWEMGKRLFKSKHRDHKKKSKKDGIGGCGLVTCRHLVAFPRLSSVALYNWTTKEWLESVSASCQHPVVHMWQDGDSIRLLVDQTLYTCVDAATEVTRKVQCNHTVALLPGSNHQITAVLHNASAKNSLQVQSVEYYGLDSLELSLEWQTEKPTSLNDDDKPKASKRTAESLTVLGPGQAGGESTIVSERRKKPRLDDKDQKTGEEEGVGGMSIADRLKKLSEVMDDEEDDYDSDRKESKALLRTDFSVQKANTESLSQLLRQALEGGEDGLLELALSVTNRDVVGETISGLDSKCVGILLTKLTMRMAGSPTKADSLATWLSFVLKSGKLERKDQLLPLKNLLQERLEAFPLLLRLEGRLNMINTNASGKGRSKRLAAE